MQLNDERKGLQSGATFLPLSRREFDVLQLLAKRPGVIRTRDEILDHVCPVNSEAFDRAVDHTIKRIRRKMRETFGRDDVIETRHGFGYCWRIDDAPGAT